MLKSANDQTTTHNHHEATLEHAHGISISALGNRHFGGVDHTASQGELFGGVDHTASQGELSQETYNFLRFLMFPDHCWMCVQMLEYSFLRRSSKIKR